MPHVPNYPTAQGFRRALLAHLRRRAEEQQVDPQRLQRLVAFDRFLARMFNDDAPPWMVKGGYALELRLQGRARATKDIDLTFPHPRDVAVNDADAIQGVREFLLEAAGRDLGDYFTFRVGEPKQELDGPPYGGARFKIEARLGGTVFNTFQLDASLGDSVVDEPEWLAGETLLDFAGIAPVRVPVLSAEQQFAEKLHAFTLPRGDVLNTRVKDLADLVLYIEMGRMDAGRVAICLHSTFARRRTHDLPTALSDPPVEWKERYVAFAEECGLRSRTLQEACDLLRDYWSQLAIQG